MKDKTTAGLLALFLGGAGIHRFYLNQAGLGIVYIILSLITCGVFAAIVHIIDALIFFFMDERNFDLKYNPEKREVHVHVHSYPEGQKPTQEQIEKSIKKTATAPKPQPTKNKVANNPHKTTGIAKFKQYDFKGAKNSFKKALTIQYDDIATHFNLACCYSMEEDIDKSLFHLSKSVELGFKDFDRIHKHDSLAFLRAHDEFIEFSDNGYQWKTIAENTKELPSPETDILHTETEEVIDELDLNAPTKEKIILTEQVIPNEHEMSFDNTENLLDDIFGADDEPAAHNPIQPKSAMLSDEILEKLEQLGSLRDKGILTDEEFNDQKKRLLG